MLSNELHSHCILAFVLWQPLKICMGMFILLLYLYEIQLFKSFFFIYIFACLFCYYTPQTDEYGKVDRAWPRYKCRW